MELPPYVPFRSIPRLSRNCVVTEKIDGTNGQVWVSDDLSIVAAGSRNRWLTLEHDNFGFARWVADNADELRKLGPGSHYGEWWGSGIQRRYGLAEKRFSLFNAGRWSSERPACCHVVPVLYAGPFNSTVVDECLTKLEREGSVAAPGFMNPEGVVVWVPAAGSYFKKTLGGDGHKSEAAAQ